MAYEENSSSIRIIPPEIITEILYCLPTKSVVRFRCVSKGWLSLLTDPDFIKTHQKTHQKTLDQNHFILLSDDYILHSLPLLHPHKPLSIQTKFPFQLDPYYSTFYGSCNGLILVSPNDIELDDHMLVVINPTTREFAELPGYHMVPKNQTLYGFGYDCVTDDYKVVTIFPDYYYMAPMNARVYSLTTNTERWVTASCNDHSYHWRMSTKFPGVFVNGYLHWIVREKSGYDVGLPVIVAFSLADECFSEVPSPNGQADIMSMEQCKLVDFGGKLAIVSLINMEGVVWLMNEYGKKESWTKIVIHGFDKIAMVDPMVSYDNGKILLAGYGRILKYDIEERSFSEPVEICRSQELLVKGVYVESLVSPKLGMTN